MTNLERRVYLKEFLIAMTPDINTPLDIEALTGYIRRIEREKPKNSFPFRTVDTDLVNLMDYGIKMGWIKKDVLSKDELYLIAEIPSPIVKEKKAPTKRAKTTEESVAQGIVEFAKGEKTYKELEKVVDEATKI